MHETSPTTIEEAQREMRDAYLSGAPGMLVSASVWVAAGVVAQTVSAQRAMWTLFFGGMLIHPIGVAVLRLLGRTARHSRGNPFGMLALANTAWLIFSMPLAYAAFALDAAWFFPAMMLVIGGRYCTFAPMFGLRAYWGCGLALAAAAYALARVGAAPATGAFSGAAIEAAFAFVVLASARRSSAVA